MDMTSNKPYLLRAYYDWIVDNELTPYILVNTHYPGVEIPQNVVESDGRVVLDLSPRACRGLHMALDRVVFTTRFSGQSVQIVINPEAVMAIYAKENGQGMHFPDEPIREPRSSFEQGNAKMRTLEGIHSQKTSQRPSLTLIKQEKNSSDDME